MRYPVPKIYSLGDSAMTIEFGDEIDEDVNQLAISCAEQLDKTRFPGFIEAAPANASTTVFFDPFQVFSAIGDHSKVLDHVRDRMMLAAAAAREAAPPTGRLIEVPARFGGEFGPDLSDISSRCGIAVSDFIEAFVGREYRVFMLGFLPGFAYMGKVEERIAVPRRDSPRRSVPAGSIGIADYQTGIYPFDSPGGWQLIGRTEITVFDKNNGPPWAFSPGDSVRFVPV